MPNHQRELVCDWRCLYLLVERIPQFVEWMMGRDLWLLPPARVAEVDRETVDDISRSDVRMWHRVALDPLLELDYDIAHYAVERDPRTLLWLRFVPAATHHLDYEHWNALDRAAIWRRLRDMAIAECPELAEELRQREAVL